jgi:hypothetical protein
MTNERQLILERIAREARTVMLYLYEDGDTIVPHLMDNDDNPGERLRNALDDLEVYDKENHVTRKV